MLNPLRPFDCWAKIILMLKILFLFFIFLSNSFIVSADDRSSEIARALTQVQEVKAEARTWEGRNTDQAYLPLLNEYETIIHDDFSYEESYHARVKIQKDSAKELGQWPIFYNKSRENIVDVKAFVETPEGKRIAATKVEDLPAYEKAPLYSDLMVKVISMPEVNIGNVLDITVKTKIQKKEMAGQYWDEIPYPVVPTKFARHTYIFPEKLNIVFKAYNGDFKPIIEKKDGRIKYSFIFKETSGLDNEPLTPPADEVNGGVYLSSISDWKTVADWYRALINKSTVDFSEITSKVNQLTKGLTTQKDKARSIVEFIQDHFLYVGMNFGDHLVEPHLTDEIYKAQYGDSKDLALLVRQMFKIAGITSNIVLMNSEFTGNPQNALPNPTLFEHVILEVQLDGSVYYIDPQTKGFDFGQLPSNYDNSNMFVIQDEGYRFDHLPVGREEDNSMINKSQIDLMPDGGAVFNVHVKLPIEASQAFRSQWAAVSQEDKSSFFEHLEANFAQGGTMLSHEVKGLDKRYGAVEFDLKYQSPNAYPVVNDMLLIKEADQGDIPDFASKDRQFPIFYPSNSLIENTNIYHVPEGFKVDFVPANYALNIDFAQVSGDFRQSADSVTVNTVYRLKRARIESKRYGEVRKFRQELYKKNDQYIILKKKSTASDQAKDWVNKS